MNKSQSKFNTNIYVKFLFVITQFVIMLCLKNLINEQKYLWVVLCFLIQLIIFLYLYYNKVIVDKIISLNLILASVYSSLAFLVIYNYLLGMLYIDYFEITKVKSPLFVSNAFLVNIAALGGTIGVVIISGALSLFLYVITILKLVLSSTDNKNRTPCFSSRGLSFTFLFLSSFYIAYSVFGIYKNPKDVKFVITYLLYNYHYYDNYVGNDLYICDNLKEIKGVKVYPLFSEKEASYAIELKKGEYSFHIAECITKY